MALSPHFSEARARCGAAIRQFGHVLVGHHADDAALTEIAEQLEHASARLAEGGPRSRDVTGFHEHWDSTALADGDVVASFDDRPISGRCSPWSVEPDIRRKGHGVTARVTFGAAHEGAPQRCHGGIVAALFDDVLGSVLGVIGEGAFTGELTVRYDAPVPLHRELVCTCWLERKDGRKLYMRGELHDGDQLVGSSHALFIQPRVAMTQSTFDPE